MTNFFALLGQHPRPWLDAQILKHEFQKVTLSAHPDRREHGVNSSEEQTEFAEINEAYRTLADPRLRLQHLLALQGQSTTHQSAVPADLGDLFLTLASLSQKTDRLLLKLRTAGNALGRSLVAAEQAEVRTQLEHLAVQLDGLRGRELDRIQQLDRQWNESQEQLTSELGLIAERLAYLDRWSAQVRERRFQVDNPT